MTTDSFELRDLNPANVSAQARDIGRCDVLGVQVSAVNMAMAVETLEGWIARRHNSYVCITGVHGVMESQRDPQLKAIHNQAGLVTPDGMPMVWVNKLRGNGHVSRVYGPDLMLEFSEISQARGYRHFYYGGGDGVADLLKRRMQERFPDLKVVGTHTPPFRALSDAEDEEICRRINDSGADVVWVGLSTPKQEYWMSRHLGRISAPAMVGVGAAFDFHAGMKKQAPRWMGRCGLEWLFRLCTEPRRLGKRYLVNNPAFVWNLALQFSGLKQYS